MAVSFEEDCPKAGFTPILGDTIGGIVHGPGRISKMSMEERESPVDWLVEKKAQNKVQPIRRPTHQMKADVRY